MNYEALVIGGGPAGSTTALALARAGWSVAIVEKAVFPRRKVCGEYISATTWPVLRELGIAGDLAPHAGPAVRRVGFFVGDSTVEAPMPPSGGEWGRAIGRDLLDTALLDRAREAGAVVLQPWTVGEVRSDTGGFAISMHDAARDASHGGRARIVIDAHGSWERDVTTTAARAPAKHSDLLGFKARFLGARLATGLMPLVLFPGGYGGMVHSDSGRVSFSCCIRHDALARGGINDFENLRKMLPRRFCTSPSNQPLGNRIEEGNEARTNGTQYAISNGFHCHLSTFRIGE